MSARSMTVGPSPLRSRPTTPVSPTPARHFIAMILEVLCRNSGSAVLLHRQLGMGVDVLVGCLERAKNVAQAGENAGCGIGWKSRPRGNSCAERDQPKAQADPVGRKDPIVRQRIAAVPRCRPRVF